MEIGSDWKCLGREEKEQMRSLKRGRMATVHAGTESQGGAGPRDGPKTRALINAQVAALTGLRAATSQMQIRDRVTSDVRCW
jgi:hypothetical protein